MNLNLAFLEFNAWRQLTTEINMYTGARPIYIFTSDEDPNDEDPATKILSVFIK